jgi:hypothetical protein
MTRGKSIWINQYNEFGNEPFNNSSSPCAHAGGE